MTTTREERREVAESLRGLRHRTYYSEEVVENIKDAISIADPVNTFREPEDVYELLADLIDPKCKVSSVETYDDELGQLEGWEFHLTCGHSFQRPWNEPPAYCPDCGARLVRDNDK